MTLLVIDIGSSSVRALLFDDEARVIPASAVSRKHQFQTDNDGASTADPLYLRREIEACIDEVLKHPAAPAISRVGMAVFVGNLLGVDANGQPLTPIYTYADTQSQADVAALADQIDLSATHQRTGCRNHTAYHPGRLRWLKRTQPEVYQNVVQWTDFATYLYRCWFGEAACSYSVASWSGLLNRAALTWDAEWLSLLDLTPEHFPPLADYDDAQTGLLPEYAQRWSVLRNIPFNLAVGDGAAANVGSGAVRAGQIALTVGTTAALRMISTDLMPVPAGLWSYRVDRDHHLTGGATSEGGSIFGWVRETFKLPEDFEAQLQQRKADEHELTFLPLLAGERAPGWTSHATGTIHGLRLSSTPLDVLQAGLEGVANRLALILEMLTAEQQPVYAGGGAMNASPAWAQMMCNALNRPLYLLAESEITARGVALLMLKALDAYPPQVEAMLTPQAEAVERLQAARQRQIRLYEQLYKS